MFSDSSTEARKGLVMSRSQTGKSVSKFPLRVRCVRDVRASNAVGLILKRALLCRYNVRSETKEVNSGPKRKQRKHYFMISQNL